MEIGYQRMQLAPLVFFNDQDNAGLLLDISHSLPVELNERDTSILNAILQCSTLREAMQQLHLCLSLHPVDPVREAEILDLLERLTKQHLLEPYDGTCDFPRLVPGVSSSSIQSDRETLARQFHRATLKQRLIGAGHILSVLNELRKDGDGLYKAYHYVWRLKDSLPSGGMLSKEAAIQLVRAEYWFYRLVTGLVERRVAHLLGQEKGDEGYCMIRSFAQCVYMLSFRVPIQIVMARPKYRFSGGFKIHFWTELVGTPLGERPNVRDGHCIIHTFPSF